jgi:hypothetical protein
VQVFLFASFKFPPLRAFCCCALTLFVAPAAHAEALTLAWDAPAEVCPSREQVLAEVERLVTLQPSKPLDARVALRATIDGYVAELSLGARQRSLSGHSCRDVAAAAIVILALAIDPNARSLEDDSAGEAGNSDAELAAPQLSPLVERPAQRVVRVRYSKGPQTARLPRRREAEAVVVSGAARGVAEFGSLPKPSFGAAAGFQAGTSRLFGEASALVLLPRFGAVPENTRAGAEIWLLLANLQGCVAPAEAAGVFGCLGFELGRLSGRGTGVDQPISGSAVWSAVAVQASARFGISRRIQLETLLGVAVPFNRPEFGLDGVGVAHRPGLVSGRWSFGLRFF